MATRIVKKYSNRCYKTHKKHKKTCFVENENAFACCCPNVPQSTFMKQSIQFRAIFEITQPILAQQVLSVSYPIKQYDLQNGFAAQNYDSLSSTFSSPINGVYHFDIYLNAFTIGDTLGEGPINLFLKVNNLTVATTSGFPIGTVIRSTNLLISTDISLKQNDKVTISAENTSEDTFSLSGMAFFLGHSVHIG